VRSDCATTTDTNSYFVPWQLVEETVAVVVLAGRVIVRQVGEVVADQLLCQWRRQRIVDRAHLLGSGRGIDPGSSRLAGAPSGVASAGRLTRP